MDGIGDQQLHFGMGRNRVQARQQQGKAGNTTHHALSATG